MPHFLRHALTALMLLFSASQFVSSARSFIDYGPATRFLDLELRAGFGGSMITENYLNCFPEISQMNTAPGASWTVGAAGVFGIRDWIGLGTEIDFSRSHYRMDLAVAADDMSSVSNIFLRNNFYTVRIPVYVQFRFNVAEKVRWLIDGGIYYSYGIGGSQRQDIYNAQVNSLGQLVSTVISTKPDYYDDGNTFVNAHHRSDIGLHVATRMRFSRISIGASLNIGFKNVAYIPGGRGIVTPNVHNFRYGVSVGYSL